jgi:hypothetical protein
MSSATATRPRGTFSANVCAELDLLGRWQPGSTLRLWNGESRSFVGVKEARVGTGPHDGWLPLPILNLVEGPTGTLSPWRADLVTSSGKASAVAVRFAISRVGINRGPHIPPGDLVADVPVFVGVMAAARDIARPSAVVSTAETMTVLWSLAFPVPAAEAADLSRALSRALAAAVSRASLGERAPGVEPTDWVPIHGFRFGTEDAAALEHVDGGRVYTVRELELAAKAAEKGEVR